MSAQPAQTPLPDLLDRVPEDTILGIHGEGPFPSYTNIPIGNLAHQAAAELRRLNQANKELVAALRRAALALAFAAESSPAMRDDYIAVSAAINKATGVTR